MCQQPLTLPPNVTRGTNRFRSDMRHNPSPPPLRSFQDNTLDASAKEELRQAARPGLELSL